MKTILISVIAGLGVYAAVFYVTNGLAAILPAIIVTFAVLLLVARKVGKGVQADMAALTPLLQRRQIKKARESMKVMQRKYGPWQILLHGQIEVQIGMLDYMQLKFDKAMPQLEAGAWRNWTALVCIGAIQHRKGRKSDAWKSFEKATASGKKEPMLYLVWAYLLNKDGDNDGALRVLVLAKKVLPDHALLAYMRDCVSNGRKIDTRKFGQTWYQYFPEDAAKQMAKGRQGQMSGGPFARPRISKKARRGR